MSEHEPDRIAVAFTAIKASWPHVMAFLGAVFSLSIVERLTPRGRAIAVAFGFTVAEAIAPIAVAATTHFAPFLSTEAVAPGLGLLCGLAAMPVIPPVLRALQARAPKLVDGLLKKVVPE